MTVLYVLVAVLTFILIFTAVELVYLLRIRALPDLPDKSDSDKYSLNINGKSFEDLYLFLCKKQADPSFSEEEIYSLLKKQTGLFKAYHSLHLVVFKGT